jgi:hypothetical protein
MPEDPQVTEKQARGRAPKSGRKHAKRSGDDRVGSHASPPALDAPLKAYQASQLAREKSTE